MKKDDLMKIEGMTEVVADKVIEAYKDYIPKSRFDEVNEAKKNAEALVNERDEQIAKLKQFEGATDDLKKQIEQLQAENKQNKINNAVAMALKDAGAKNIKTILPLLTDLSEIDENGIIKGLDKQIEALKNSDETSFLFKGVEKITGATPVNTGAKPNTITKEQFARMGYKERNELFNSNRELFDTLSKED